MSSIKNHTGKKAVLGDHLMICDFTGRVILASEAKKTWNGLWVHHSVWETRHPQDFLRAKKEKIAPEQPIRPEPAVDTTINICTRIYEFGVYDEDVYMLCAD